MVNGLPDHCTQFLTINNIYTVTNIMPLKQKTKTANN